MDPATAKRSTCETDASECGQCSRARGSGRCPTQNNVRSPETYIGYARAEQLRIARRDQARRGASLCRAHSSAVERVGLAGQWVPIANRLLCSNLLAERSPFHFHARDLHLVLGPSTDGKPVRFRVTIDGPRSWREPPVWTQTRKAMAPLRDNRLYQLVRQKETIADHIFIIEFEEPGVQAFSFTFG